MPAFQLNINNTNFTAEADGDMPLLWVLRDILGLTGTKYGCGVSSCGACTVLYDGKAVRSCQLKLESIGSAKITTIEGLSEDGSHPVQKAWEKAGVPQCGYCQSGQIMSVVGMLNTNKQPTEGEINNAMSGNLCRCGTYSRIKEAILDAIHEMNG
jgi:isoquinoline 1-oxidoreductase alpha subunit